MKKINIAIDGPAAAGKGTVAKLVAGKLGYKYIDSGVMYRLLAYILVKRNIGLDEENKIVDILINEFDYVVKEEKVYFYEEDVTNAIRGEEVNRIVGSVAGLQYVRKFFVDLLKNIASEKGVVMDGRDITSVVMSDAELKIYLDADFEERVKRRYKEQVLKKDKISIEEIRESMKARDNKDLDNKTLMRCNDSIFIDSTYMSIEEVASKILEIAEERSK